MEKALKGAIGCRCWTHVLGIRSDPGDPGAEKALKGACGVETPGRMLSRMCYLHIRKIIIIRVNTSRNRSSRLKRSLLFISKVV